MDSYAILITLLGIIERRRISVSPDGFEPSTFSLRGNCSTTELRAQKYYLQMQWQALLPTELRA